VYFYSLIYINYPIEYKPKIYKYVLKEYGILKMINKKKLLGLRFRGGENNKNVNLEKKKITKW
jgi:hypothetical protein